MHHRGSHHSHYGVPFQATYSRRGYQNDDKMLDLIEQFRAFKPYLRKRLDYINQSNRALELRDEVEDIQLYLDVMQEVLGDDKYDADQIRGFIDKIHEMIRKNPMTELPSATRGLLDHELEEFGDDDRPRSPSPGPTGSAMSSGGAASQIPLESSHDTHRVVEVNFTTGGADGPIELDEWGKPKQSAAFTRRGPLPFQDVDMRSSFYNNTNSGGIGRGQPNRYSSDCDTSGARSFGRGIGRGAPLSSHRRDDYDARMGHHSAYGESDPYFGTDSHYLDRTGEPPREKKEIKAPAWLLDSPSESGSNNTGVNDRQRHSDGWNNGRDVWDNDTEGWNNGNWDRRHRDDWKRSQSDLRHEKYRQELNRYAERRPSSESRHHDNRNEFDRPPGSSPRAEMSSPPMNQGLGPRDYPGVRPPFPPQSNRPIPPPTMMPPHMRPGYAYNQHNHPYNPNTGPGLLPTPPSRPYPGPHISQGQNASSGPVHPPSQPPVGDRSRTMGFQQPQVSAYGRPHPPPPAYHRPPPQMPRNIQPPQPPDAYQNYNDADESSPDNVRQISSRLAKQCFNRRPATSSSQARPSPVLSPPSSPGSHSPSRSPVDPRLQRQSRPGPSHVQRVPRHASPPDTSPSPQQRRPPTSDAGNVLRVSPADPRGHRSDFDKRRQIMDETRERVRQAQAAIPIPKQPSKLAEIRKQIEKEGFHRLGRPNPKTKSFEDALASCDTEPEAGSSREKSKSTSPTRTKDKDESRSQSNKTDAEKSAKSSGDKHKNKDKSVPGTSGSGEKQSNKEGANDKGQRKKSKQADKNDKSKSKKASARNANSARSKSAKATDIPPTLNLSGFKIPRKPKPKQPESDLQIVSVRGSQKDPSDKDSTPPSSPEPALSQMTDHDNRTEDHEPASSSRTNSDDPPPDKIKELKKVLMGMGMLPTSNKDDNLSDEKVKQIFKKLKELTEKSSEEPNSNQTEAEGPGNENDTLQDGDVQERGRSREKKRNSKRRSSLEKLHDALKEMRFDTMLPLGPRRCTRGGQDETAENDTSAEVAPSDSNSEDPQPSTSAAMRKPEESTAEGSSKKPNTRKRGRPPKDSPKKGKTAKGKKSTTVQSSTTNVPDVPDEPETVAEVPAPPARRGRKRKMKAAKVNPKKRVKKSGPVTRAQAALKKSKGLSKTAANAEPTGFDNSKDNIARKKKLQNTFLRRATRSRMGTRDTLVDRNVCKIKVEANSAERVKKEMAMKAEAREVDNFFDSGNDVFDVPGNDESNVGSQLADIIDDIDLASMDRQTEDNMDLDLDVFNSFGPEDQEEQVIVVKDELDIPMEDENGSDLSYEVIMNKTSTASPRKSRRSGASSISPACIENVSQTKAATATVIEPNSELHNTPESKSTDNQVSSLVDSKGSSTSPPVAAAAEGQNANSEVGSTETAASSSDLLGEGVNVNVSLAQNNIVAVNDGVPDLIDSSKTGDSPVSSNVAPISDSSSSDPPSVAPDLSSVAPKVENSNDNEDKIDLSEVKTELDSDETRKDVFKCEQCNFSGKKIVSHYVNKHYPCNIPQARLMSETFEGLIELNSSASPQLLEIILDEMNSPVWPCLYCDDRYDCIVDFYDHLTSHTGEFRYECSECGISYPHQRSLLNHVKQHKGIAKNCVRYVFDASIVKGAKDLSGFLCNDCYYFQLRFESIMRHIEETKHSALDVKSVKLIFTPSAKSNSAPVDKNAADSDKSEDEPNKDKDNKVPESPRVNSSNNPETSGSSLVEVKNEVVSEGKMDSKEEEKTCAFFTTDVNFSPPTVTLGDCTTVKITPVFEGKFLDSLCKRLFEDDDEPVVQKPESDDTSSSKENILPEKSENRKRKRSGGSVEEEHNDGITKKVSLPLKDGDVSVDSPKPEEPAARRGPNLRTTCTSRANKMIKLKWKDDIPETAVEEPNNFLESSDESSSETESSGEEDENPAQDVKVKVEVKNEVEVKTEPTEDFLNTDTGYFRNNEHLIKTRAEILEDDFDLKVKKLNKVVSVKRVGDYHAPNSVLYGFIKPAVMQMKTHHKLRDIREVERLSMVQGRRVHPVKDPKKLEEMLTPEKLLQFFKCMNTYCSFTCDLPQDFFTHLYDEHYAFLEQSCARFLTLGDFRDDKDSGCCSYCSVRYLDPKELVDHVVNQHGLCVFQCNKCFYRSFYHRYVVKHFELEHPNEPNRQVLKSPKKVENVVAKEATLFQIFVYKCDINNPDCDKSKRFVFREDFLEHLSICGQSLKLFPCHLCKASLPLSEIVDHYKIHNLFKFHCSYCQFGSEIKTDLDEHFVHLHPNTSGRVFYRTKPTPTSPAGGVVISIQSRDRDGKRVNQIFNRETGSPTQVERIENSNTEKEPQSHNESVGNENSLMDVSESEDGEKGRVTNLKGHDLYRCTTGECGFTATDSDKFREHVTTCTYVTESRSLSCAHCERKLKSVTNLMEHLKVHGEKKQACSLCSFRCWTSAEITKHVKTVHRMMNYKLIRNDPTPQEPDPDVIAFPKDVATKSACDVESFENHYYTFSRKAVYSYENINKLPLSKVFGSDLFCAMCPYSTKVRSNIIRHLAIHKQALEDGKTVVPQAPRINPVPYLSREGLEFDKMMNLAASSHKSSSGTATADDVRKLPEFVKEQFRYVCSVCDHITSDDGLLQTHIKVIHNEVSVYKCPHCQKNPETRDNPDNTVSLEKIPHHLRLHGPKLYKCGHCMVIHHQLRLMEKHIPEKHPEKKPIHYLIRDVDPDGIPSARPTTSGMSRRQSVDESKLAPAEKWKCFLCSSKNFFGSWLEAKNHCESIHKVTSQFRCLICEFTSDDVTEMLTHCRENCKTDKKNQILVMFSKCETFDADDSSVTLPVWKRHGGAVRHIHGNFTEDSVALIKQYNSQQGSSNDQSSSSSASPARGAPGLPPPTSKNPVKPTSTTGAKARRSVTFPPPPPKLNAPPIPAPVVAKQEVFKYRCHKCDMYKTKNANELRVHLFNEFRYKRWKCLICSTTFTTEKSLRGHIERDHQQLYQREFYELQPENFEIEAEINECIEKQNRKRDMINSFAMEKNGNLTCKHCKEDGLTYDTFETHILLKHSG